MRFSKTEGFVIRKVDVKERDQIITFFTRDFGLIDFYTFGIRSQKSKRRSFFEPLNILEISFKKNESRLSTLGETKLVSTNANLLNPRSNFAEIFILSEIVYKLTLNAEEDLDTYATIRYLIQDQQIQSKVKLIAFLVKYLTSHGFIQDLRFDVKTTAKLELTKQILKSDSEPGYFNLNVEVSDQKNKTIKKKLASFSYFANSSKEDWHKLVIDESEAKQMLNDLLDFVEIVVEAKLKSRFLL